MGQHIYYFTSEQVKDDNNSNYLWAVRYSTEKYCRWLHFSTKSYK